MTSLSSGTLFSVALAPDAHLTGRVVLPLNLAVAKQLPTRSPLGFSKGAVLIEMFATVWPEPTAETSDRLIPGVLIDSGYLDSGSWPEVGSQPVKPKEVEFPVALSFAYGSIRLQRGEVYVPTPLTPAREGKIRVRPTRLASNLLPGVCRSMLQMGIEGDLPGLERFDLRYSPHRDEVYESLPGYDPDQTYDSFALQHGHDIRRLLDQPPADSEGLDRWVPWDASQEMGFVCQACLWPVARDQETCHACRTWLKKERAVESKLSILRSEPRSVHATCNSLKPDAARRCAVCGE